MEKQTIHWEAQHRTKTVTRRKTENASAPPVGAHVIRGGEGGTRKETRVRRNLSSAAPGSSPEATSPPPCPGCRLLPSWSRPHSPLWKGAALGAKEHKWAPLSPLCCLGKDSLKAVQVHCLGLEEPLPPRSARGRVEGTGAYKWQASPFRTHSYIQLQGEPLGDFRGLVIKEWLSQGRLLDPRREGACPGGEPGCRLDPDPMHASLQPRGETEAGPQVRAI